MRRNFVGGLQHWVELATLAAGALSETRCARTAFPSRAAPQDRQLEGYSAEAIQEEVVDDQAGPRADGHHTEENLWTGSAGGGVERQGRVRQPYKQSRDPSFERAKMLRKDGEPGHCAPRRREE